jgi:hypothetical protein
VNVARRALVVCPRPRLKRDRVAPFPHTARRHKLTARQFQFSTSSDQLASDLCATTSSLHAKEGDTATEQSCPGCREGSSCLRRRWWTSGAAAARRGCSAPSSPRSSPARAASAASPPSLRHTPRRGEVVLDAPHGLHEVRHHGLVVGPRDVRRPQRQRRALQAGRGASAAGGSRGAGRSRRRWRLSRRRRTRTSGSRWWPW